MKTGLINNSGFYKLCSGCQRRSESCHSGCKDYAVEVIMGALIEADKRKNAANREAEFHVCAQRAARIARSSHSAKRAMQGNSYLKSR